MKTVEIKELYALRWLNGTGNLVESPDEDDSDNFTAYPTLDDARKAQAYLECDYNLSRTEIVRVVSSKEVKLQQDVALLAKTVEKLIDSHTSSPEFPGEVSQILREVETKER